MKRFYLVMLSLGIVLAFSTSAMAVDVKVSGSFYAAGMYQDKTTFKKDSGTDGPSTAFYYQRLRVNTELVVSPGLSLVTRFDAMERAWGAGRTAPFSSVKDMNSSGTMAENENIAFDLAYVSYTSPIGMFRVGYQDDGAWGTVFGDTTAPLAKITYAAKLGSFIAIAYIAKYSENSNTQKQALNYADNDADMYVLASLYQFKDGSVGLLGKAIRVANFRVAPASVMTGGAATQSVYALLPYVKAKIGPVSIQAEVIYAFGDYVKHEIVGALPDSKLDNLGGWVDVTADFGTVYVGGSVAYVSGDDPTTLDKKEGGLVNGGADWNPTLILFNFDRYYWAGAIPGYGDTQNPNNANYTLAPNSGGMVNAWLLQGRVGVRPVDNLDIMASLSYATADKKFAARDGSGIFPVLDMMNGPTSNGTYGYEVDVIGTYKITDNLSYMLGVGYLFTGDYFKGTETNVSLKNNYLLINKLTLTF